MAYMTKDGKGPYPNRAGEHCGNHLVGSRAYAADGESPEQAAKIQDCWLATMRFGLPRKCKAGTSEEIVANGWVGLYLKEDSKLLPGEVEIPTPPELMEPPSPSITGASKGDKGLFTGDSRKN